MVRDPAHLAASVLRFVVSLVWCGVGLFIGFSRPDFIGYINIIKTFLMLILFEFFQLGGGRAIIYCATRKKVELVAKALKQHKSTRLKVDEGTDPNVYYIRSYNDPKV